MYRIDFTSKYNFKCLFKLIICASLITLIMLMNCNSIYGKASKSKTDYDNNKENTYESDKNQSIYEETKNESLTAYDFSEIDRVLDNETDYNISFKDVVSTILGENEESSEKGFIGAFNLILADTLKSNRTAIIQIIILAILSSLIECFGPDFQKGQVSDTAQMVISISLITILIASFYTALRICTDILSSCINIYKAVIPVFFSAVTFSSGSVTTAAYYEVVIMIITIINIVFLKVLVSMNKVYVLFSLADSVSGEERFTKAAEFIPAIIKWTCRTSIIIFTGLAGIRGMIAPMSDSLKKNLLFKTLQMIPGIGNSVETVSQTVIGAGTIVKNGIGSAAIIIIVLVCLFPLLKLVIITCLFKITAAAIEPVTDKRIVKAVNSVSVAAGSFALIVLVSLSLFVLVIGIICLTTNVNYMS